MNFLTGGVMLFGSDGLVLVGTIVIIALVVRQTRSADQAGGADVLGRVRLLFRDVRASSTIADPPPGAVASPARPQIPARQRLARPIASASGSLVDRSVWSLRRAAFTLGGLAVAAGGAVLLAHGTTLVIAALVLLGGAALASRQFDGTQLPVIDDATVDPGVLLGRIPGIVRLAIPTALTIAVFFMNRARPLQESRDDVVLLWVLAMVTALLAVAPALRRSPAGDRRYLLALGGITLLALAIRTWNGDSYPWPVFQDEGLYALEALKTIDGVSRNPFSTGWQSQQTMLWFLQGAVMRVFGEDLAGSRLLAAIVGTGAVTFVFLYARRMFGLVAGVVAGILSTVFHAAVYFSRAGWPSAGDILFMPLVLWLIDRGVFGRRQFEALLAGFVIGFAQYYYQGGRAFIIVAGAILLYGLAAAWRERSRTPGAVASFLRVAWLTPAGAVVAFAPFAAYALDYWVQYTGRIKGVSMFSSGWLDREMEATGNSAADIIFHRFLYALGVLVRGPVDGHFRPEAPFVGWPLVVPVAAGLAFCLVKGWQRRYAGMAIAFIVTTVLVTMTEAGRLHSNRFAALIPLAMIAAGLLVDVAWRSLRRLVPVRSIATCAVAAFVLYTSWWHLHFYFKSPYQTTIYSTGATELATQISYDLQPFEDQVTLYVLGAPDFFYRGMPVIQFLAPEAVGFDVESPVASRTEPFALDEFTIFIVIPRNGDDLATLRAWYPEGVQRDVYNRDGTLLYHEYRVNPGVGG